MRGKPIIEGDVVYGYEQDPVRMTVRITKAVAGENRTDWFPGDVVECSEYFARRLIVRGRAVPFVEEAAEQPQPEIAPEVEADSGLGATVRGLFRRSPSIERTA